MRKLKAFLSNPVWQGLSVLITVIGIFLSISNSKSNEVSIIPTEKFTHLSEYFPDSKIKFTIEGETSNLDNLYYRYFYVYNNSNLPLTADDFKKKISVKSRNSNFEILLVSSCRNKNELKEMSQISEPQFNWSKSKQGWELEPELLNSEEGGCVIMVVRNFPQDQTGIADIKESDFIWDGRIVGTRLKIYSSPEEYWESNTNITNYLQVTVAFGTEGVLWFLVLQYFLFIVPLYIAEKIKVIFLQNVNNAYIFVLFSITTSEILVSKFINGNQQHPVVWPLLLMHLLLFIYLAYRTYKLNKV
ncbi:MAG: hypothetical protein HOP06_08790 [Methylotenera sp.]|nr:hypothetical protein [Methylotenera sp.]